MNDIGIKISNLRKEKGMSQDQLAIKVGVTRQAISKWERCEGFPDLHNTKLLAEFLNVSVDHLIGGESMGRFESKRKYRSRRENRFINNILAKVQNTTNKAEVKKIKKNLIIFGAIITVVGVVMIISALVSFMSGPISAFSNFGGVMSGGDPFSSSFMDANPFGNFFGGVIRGMVLFLVGGLVTSFGTLALKAGLSIAVVDIASDYLDSRSKCPNCKDPIDEDEKMCSNCGTDLQSNLECSHCHKINSDGDKFCRECGNKL